MNKQKRVEDGRRRLVALPLSRQAAFARQVAPAVQEKKVSNTPSP